jgi:hypothetical protein
MANYSHQLHDMVTQSEMTSTRDMQVEIRAKLAHRTQQFQTLLDERTRPPGERPGAGPHFSNPNQGFQGGGSSSPKGSSSGMGVTLKIVWLELPHFNGDDPKTWCDRASQFFDFYGTLDSHRLSISSFHMDDKADDWFQELNATHSASQWADFVQALQARFSAPEKVEDLAEVEDNEEEQRVAEGPKHSTNTATDLVVIAYHLSYVFPPRISKYLKEQQILD